MQLAADWPRDERATVGELAGRLGYRFEAAFARALKREVGVSPGRSDEARSRAGGEFSHSPKVGWRR
jgi:AraC-like DNA-binding protein